MGLKTTVLLALLLFSAQVQAQQALLSMQCAPLKELMRGLQSKEVNEKPGWIGAADDEGVYYALFYNQDTSGWTLVRYERSIGCVLGLGSVSQFWTKDETIKNFPMHAH